MLNCAIVLYAAQNTTEARVGLVSIFKGVNDQFEVNRVLGAFGTTAYVLGAHAFLAYDIIVSKHQFNLVSYCASFPFGLGVAIGSVAGAVSLKDRSVAAARQTQAATDATRAATAASAPAQ